MWIRSFLDESRAFIVGRITAGFAYAGGAFTMTSGVAKAAADSGSAPSWVSNLSVDTMGIIIGALFTILTGVVSMWAKRRDTQMKEQQHKRERAAWVMRMLRENGEEAMVKEFGRNWRKREYLEISDSAAGPLE